MLDYKLWIGFAEYIEDRAGSATYDYASAASLRQELRSCEKKKRAMGSFWKLLAQRLFGKYSIKDERLDFGEILREVTYKVNGKEYTTKIGYIIQGIDKFPAESILVLNANNEEEKAFIIRTMKSFIERHPNADTDKIFAHQNYLNILLKPKEEDENIPKEV